MPRTGKNIYKRKDGRWEGRFMKGRVDGKIRYGAVYAHTYSEVCKKLEIAKQEWQDKEKKPAKDEKMSIIAENWLNESRSSLKESSFVRYQDILRCYILPVFGEKKLMEIRNEELKLFCNDLVSKGGAQNQGLSKTTVSQILTVMSCIRVYAIGQDYMVSYNTKCVSLKKEKKKIRVFTQKEQELLVEYIKNHMDTVGLGIYLCLYTGIRVGELCALKWNSVFLEEGVMHIAETMQRIRVDNVPDRRTEVKIYTPKTGSSIRDIPLPKKLVDILLPFYQEGAFLLTGDKNHFMEPRTVQVHFKKMLAACGIKDANFHTTRHTFATRCVERGFDVKSLSEILGHASVSITMDRYIHPSMDLKSKNMELLF